MELYGLTRQKAVLIVCFFTFTMGIPSAYSFVSGVFPDWTGIYGTNFLDTLDRLVSIWLIPIGGLITSLFVGWVWDKNKAEIAFLEGSKGVALFSVWRFWMRWVIPALIFLIILQKSGLIDFDKVLLS